MPEKNYAKRELDHYFNDLFRRMDAQDEVLIRVEEQTSKTNGRVNKLEWWQKAVIWGVGALWAFILIIIPVMVTIFKHELERTVNSIVDRRFTTLFKDYDKIIIDNK